jgi:hypothetical protein
MCYGQGLLYRPCTVAEEELPPEWELYLQAVTAVQERWAAEKVGQLAPLHASQDSRREALPVMTRLAGLKRPRSCCAGGAGGHGPSGALCGWAAN